MIMDGEHIWIRIPKKLGIEIIARSRGKIDIETLAEHELESFLDGTRHDRDIWDEAIIDDEEETERAYGPPDEGYRWQNVLLPNGTEIRMTYKGERQEARVVHGELQHWALRIKMSPSEFASHVAGGSNRNAWRDLWVKRPRDSEWVLADALRRAQKLG